MSYENAPATIMLASHCAVCGRPLVDAQSVELGIGPDCRRKYGFDMPCDEAARAEANALVYRVALVQEGVSVAEACARLRVLGFEKLAARIEKRAVDVRIEEVGDRLRVSTRRYVEEATASWRSIRGRRWDGEAKANEIPASERRALWSLLTRHYPGAVAMGPRGPFTVAKA